MVKSALGIDGVGIDSTFLATLSRTRGDVEAEIALVDQVLLLFLLLFLLLLLTPPALPPAAAAPPPPAPPSPISILFLLWIICT